MGVRNVSSYCTNVQVFRVKLTMPCQVLFGLRELVYDQVCFASVLVCAAVSWVELQRSVIMPEGESKLAGVAIRVAERVLHVSIARVAQCRRVERLDRCRPILG